MFQHWQWKRYGFPLSFSLSSCGAFEPVVNNVAPAPCFFLSLKLLIWSRDIVVLLDFVSASMSVNVELCKVVSLSRSSTFKIGSLSSDQ